MTFNRLHSLRNWRILIFAITYFLLSIPITSFAQTPAANSSTAARDAFAAGNYDKAIDLFRDAVRLNPKDFDSWTQLAAAYYHSGLPRRALQYLKMSEKKTNLRSYNLLYQGLAYESLGIMEKSRLFLKNSAQFPDQYGERATYELGVMDYKSHNKERATYWLNLCIQRHPQGRYRQPATNLLANIRSGKHINNIQDTEQPDLESALYKYNKLSLMPTPHYWFTNIGGTYLAASTYDKDDSGVFTTRTDEYEAITAGAGIGIGPVKKEFATVWAGYNYLQDWTTTNERIQIYAAEPSDIAYQPFRADLLERHHQIYANISQEFPFHIYTGAYLRLEFARIGSSIFSGPEIQSLESEVQVMSDTTWFIPWIGYNWNTNMRTFAYAYFRKEVNSEVPDFSNKSYNFETGSGQTPRLSLGISHEMELPKYKTEATTELYSYEFISNDPWLDYSRLGINFTVEHQVIPQLYISLTGGYYQDTYIQTILKNGSCDFSKIVEGATLTEPNAPTVVQDCYRNETGNRYRLATYWNFSQFQRIGGVLSFVNNLNPQQKEFERTELSILGTATLAFPSVKRVTTYANRFADPAFIKKNQ